MKKTKISDELVIIELKKIEKYKNISDTEAQNIIDDLKTFCQLIVSTVIASQQLTINNERRQNESE